MHLRHKLILVFTVFALQSFAQRDSLRRVPKIFVSVNAGSSIPTGNYGLDNDPSFYQNNEVVPHYSYAEQGYYYYILAGITLKGNKWEPQLLISHATNPVDMYDFMSNSIIGIQVLTPSQGFPITGNPTYSYYNIMPGIARTISSKYISLDIKFMVGLSFGQLSGAHFYAINDGNGKSDGAQMSASSYAGFAYDFGIG